MDSGHSLIDKAAAVCGSRYALAKRLEISESTLSQIASGRRSLPAAMAARIAEVAGVDARNAAAVALYESEKDPKVKEALRRAFGLATEAATWLFFITAVWTAPFVITDAKAAQTPYPRATYTANSGDTGMFIMSTH